MLTHRETPYVKRSSIVTGHYKWAASADTWRSHGTEDWLIIYTIGGRGRFGYRSGEMKADPGDAILLRPRTLHDYGPDPSVGRWEIVWAHFDPRPEWSEWLAWPEIAPGLMRLRLAEEDRKWMERGLFEAHRREGGIQRRREAFALNALEEVLLRCDERNPLGETAAMDGRVRKAMDHINRFYKEPIAREAVAEASGLSVSRLSHLFREQTGMSLQQFQEQLRLHRAKQLLEYSPLSVQEVAEEVGYENPFYFTLRFKRYAGMSPRAYRQSRYLAFADEEARAEPPDESSASCESGGDAFAEG
jgi:AraC family transcriptional regulator of arabinose operon